MTKFEQGMDLVDTMYREMFKKKTNIISMKFSDSEKEAIDHYLKVAKHDDSNFKLTWDNNTLTCEVVPKKLNEELVTQIKSGLIKAFNSDATNELAEAGRKFMAQYYVDYPEEFTLLIQNMTEYRNQKLAKDYTEAFKQKRAKFMEYIESLNK